MRGEMSFHADVRNWLVRPFRGQGFADRVAIATLLVLWQAANASGFFYESLVRTGYAESKSGNPGFHRGA